MKSLSNHSIYFASFYSTPSSTCLLSPVRHVSLLKSRCSWSLQLSALPASSPVFWWRFLLLLSGSVFASSSNLISPQCCELSVVLAPQGTPLSSVRSLFTRSDPTQIRRLPQIFQVPGPDYLSFLCTWMTHPRLCLPAFPARVWRLSEEGFPRSVPGGPCSSLVTSRLTHAPPLLAGASGTDSQWM